MEQRGNCHGQRGYDPDAGGQPVKTIDQVEGIGRPDQPQQHEG
jgi:hypothetical protein